jgi:hypothetical protein
MEQLALSQKDNLYKIDQNPQETRYSIALKKGTPVLEGLILKKNKWLMKQLRRFKLYANGDLKYFKD